MRSELITEATASLKKEIEEELKIADPQEGSVAMVQLFNRALSGEEITEKYGQGDTP